MRLLDSIYAFNSINYCGNKCFSIIIQVNGGSQYIYIIPFKDFVKKGGENLYLCSRMRMIADQLSVYKR